MDRRYQPSNRITGLPRSTWNEVDSRIKKLIDKVLNQVSSIAAITPSDGQFIVGDGTKWAGESGNTARTSLGLGTGNTPTFTNLNLSSNPSAANFTYDGTFAEIYVHGGSTAQTISTGATYTKSTAFTTDGQSNDCTSDSSNDKITITRTGRYLVTCSVSCSCDTASVDLIAGVFLNAVEQTNLHAESEYSTANETGTMSISGFIDVTTAPWDLDLRFKHDNGGDVDVTVTEANLSILRVAGT